MPRVFDRRRAGGVRSMFQKVVKSEPDKTEKTQETSKAKKSANFTRRFDKQEHSHRKLKEKKVVNGL
jgi:hypothetical protein